MNAKPIYERLALIQEKLNVTKDRMNDYGGFAYRNAEDILKVAKPLALEQSCVITMGEELVELNGQAYVKSTASLVAYDLSDNDTVSAMAFAREAVQKSGMDVSQITGSATSYARKYALGGLFAIDDGRDADGMDNRDQRNAKKKDYVDKRAYTMQRAKQAADMAVAKYKKSGSKPRIDFAEVRQKLETITDVEALEAYWRELSPSDSQAKFLQRDFAKRKEVLNGVE